MYNIILKFTKCNFVELAIRKVPVLTRYDFIFVDGWQKET